MNGRQFFHLCLSFFILLLGGLGWGFYFNKEIVNKTKTISSEIARLENSYARYNLLTGKQLHIIWIDLFYGAVYKMDGKIKENKYDCVSAEWKFFRSLGSNAVLENTKYLEERLKRVSIPHKSIATVRAGDIIIFKRNGTTGHVGIVEGTYQNLVKYMDMNNYDKGIGFASLNFKNKKIKAIYPVTFDFWCGDILYRK